MNATQYIHDPGPKIPAVPKQTSGEDSRGWDKNFFSTAQSINTGHTIGRDEKQSIESIKLHALQEFIPSVLIVGGIEVGDNIVTETFPCERQKNDVKQDILS